jgi:uncharacterized low-complexity protein
MAVETSTTGAQGDTKSAAADGATSLATATVPAAETKPAAAAAGETKPAETTPADTKAAETTTTKAGETKPGETKAAETKTAQPGDQKAAVVPEKYTLQVPEAAKHLIVPSHLARLEAMGKANGWTNEQTQIALENFATDIKALSDGFAETTKADPDYGGDHLPETQRLARAAIQAVRPEGHPKRESFLRFLNESGAGNHIEALSFLADLGKALGEDAPALGKSKVGSTESAADRLYDNPTSKTLDGRA